MTTPHLRLTGCSLITDRALVGTWGSPDAELIAIQAGAEVHYGCSTIVIRGPIALAPDNTFAARAVWS